MKIINKLNIFLLIIIIVSISFAEKVTILLDPGHDFYQTGKCGDAVNIGETTVINLMFI